MEENFPTAGHYSNFKQTVECLYFLADMAFKLDTSFANCVRIFLNIENISQFTLLAL